MIRRLADRVRALLSLMGPLGAGGRVLLLRLIGRYGWKAVLIGAAVLAYAADRNRKWIWAGVAVLCALAWMHAPEQPERGPETEGEQPPAEAPVDPLPGILWELIGDAPGVHLKTVVAHLHETGQDTTCDRAAVRAALTRRQIPYRPSVRNASGKVNEGVHRDDLTAWDEARSPTPSVSLSKTRSNPVATALTSDVAEPATAVATPATPPNVPEN